MHTPRYTTRPRELNKLDNNNYIEIWKEWNKLIWYTPIAFITILSALGALAKFIFDNGAKFNKIIPEEVIVNCALNFAGISLLICAAILYRFAICRELTSVFISRYLEQSEINGCFKNWATCRKIKGYDLLAFLLNATAFNLINIAYIMIANTNNLTDTLPINFIISFATSLIFTFLEWRLLVININSYKMSLK